MFSMKLRVAVALVTVQVLFGINYVASKAIVGIFPPLVWASFRIGVSTILLAGIAILSNRKHPKLNGPFFVSLTLYSLLGIVINQASFLTGLKYTTATNSAILCTLIPVFTLLFVTLSGQEPLTGKKIIGFLAAFAGIIILRKGEDFTLSNQTLLGDALTILNCASYGLFLTFSRRFVRSYDSVWITTWLFMSGSVGLTSLALPSWLTFHWPALTPLLWVNMVFSVIGCTLLGYFLNVWALARTQSSSVALYIYLQPVVATLLAWLWLGETISFRTVLSCLFILGGMLIAIQDSRAPTKKVFLIRRGE